MKNFIFLFIFLTNSLFACKKDVTSEPFLEIASEQLILNFKSTGESRFITVNTNKKFTAISTAEWCSTKILEDNINDNLKITVGDNTSPKERKSEIIINVEGVPSVKIEITQLGIEPAILANKKTILIEEIETDFSLEIISNIPVKFVLPEWITEKDHSFFSGVKNCTFTAKALPSDISERTGEIKIIPDNDQVKTDSVIIIITQSKFQPLRFAVISDIHFGKSDAKSKVARALQNLISKTPRIDAVFVVGDLTDYGRKSQYDDLNEVFTANIPGDLPVYFMMGNHDHYSDDGNAEDNYASKIRQPLHQFIEIKKYPFITVSMSGGGTNSYDQRGTDFLSGNLSEAGRKYPKKPIFVFTHVGVLNTAYGTKSNEGWGTGFFEKTLSPYPQAIVFSGHSHFPLGDPRSIHQRNFTSINDGSTTYSEIESGFSEGIHPPNYQDVTEGLIVSVKENGDVEIERWDTYRNEEILPKWTVSAPHDGSSFTYKDRTGEQSPAFTSGIKPVISEIGTNDCTVSFSQATDDEIVHHYMIEANPVNGSSGISATVFSQFYMNSSTPSFLSYKISGLGSGTEYTISVKAVDSYDNQSKEIVSDKFTTIRYEPDPSAIAPVAGLFDIHFNHNGAYDRSVPANTLVRGTDSPVTFFDPSVNDYVATFTGSNQSHYKLWYKDNTVIKSALPNSFSLEVYYKASASGGCPVSAQESGGVGIEQDGYTPQLWAYIGGGYKKVGNVSINTTHFFHVIYTYDKSEGSMSAFINGAPAGKTSVTGNLTFPSDSKAHWFGIGGDASTSDATQFTFKGNIVYTRLYDKAVSRDEAYRLFEQTKNRGNINNIDKIVQFLLVDIPNKMKSSDSAQKIVLEKMATEGWGILSDYYTTQQNVDSYISKVSELLN